MADDAQLLRQFVETRSQAAFAELVQRHLALVYHAAARQLGSDRHLAEDVAQSVFVLLAEKSESLLDHPSVAGWLHTATHFKVARVVRSERRRQLRDNTALVMSELARDSTPVEWERLRPVLDPVLQELNARDREAILLRYFENCAFSEIAARLQLTETAAHKVVERACDKLRARLALHGVTSSAAALAVWLSSQGALAAPSGLATTVTGAVIASGLPVAGTIGGLAFMSSKTTLGVAALILILGGGAATYELQVKRNATDTLSAAAHEVSALRARQRADQERIARERTETLAAAKPPSSTARPLTFTEERELEGRAFLKAHPEVRSALVAYYLKTLRYKYTDLIAALRLSDGDTERFLTVVMNGFTRIVGDHVFRLTDEPPAPEEYTRQLKEVLGEDGFRQFRAYERAEPARSLANEMTRSLYYTPAALSPVQIEQFKGVIQQVLDDRSFGPRYDSVWDQMPMPVWNEVVKRAGRVLSPPQLDALANLQQQLIFRHAESAARDAYDKK